MAYTNYGKVDGCCGHVHGSLLDASKCREKYGRKHPNHDRQIVWVDTREEFKFLVNFWNNPD